MLWSKINEKSHCRKNVIASLCRVRGFFFLTMTSTCRYNGTFYIDWTMISVDVSVNYNRLWISSWMDLYLAGQISFESLVIAWSFVTWKPGDLNINMPPYSIGVHIIKIRRSRSHLIFLMKILTHGEQFLYWNRDQNAKQARETPSRCVKNTFWSLRKP